MGRSLSRENLLSESFFNYAKGQLSTILLLKEKEEQKNIYSILVKQVIYHLFSLSFWDHLFTKAVARALWYIVAGRKDIEKLLGVTYEELLNDWVKKNKGQITKDDIDFIKSTSFDSNIIFSCRMEISQNFSGKHQHVYDVINKGIKELDNVGPDA